MYIKNYFDFLLALSDDNYDEKSKTIINKVQ